MTLCFKSNFVHLTMSIIIILEYMWLHIRAVGEWTNSLYAYFEKEQQKLERGDAIAIEGFSSPPAAKNPYVTICSILS